MNLEQHVAGLVRKLPDSKLAAMALKAGFTISLDNAKPRKSDGKTNLKLNNGKSNGKAPVASAKDKVTKKKAAKNNGKSPGAPAGPGAAKGKNRVLAFLQKQKLGVGIGDVTRECGMARSEAEKAVKELIADGNAFKGGKARYTRYATTQKVANIKPD